MYSSGVISWLPNCRPTSWLRAFRTAVGSPSFSHGRTMLIRFGAWAIRMNTPVTRKMTVRRRRGLAIRLASQPWNWYVTAVRANRNASRSGSRRNSSGLLPIVSPTMRPIIPGTNTISVRLNSELR